MQNSLNHITAICYPSICPCNVLSICGTSTGSQYSGRSIIGPPLSPGTVSSARCLLIFWSSLSLPRPARFANLSTQHPGEILQCYLLALPLGRIGLPRFWVLLFRIASQLTCVLSHRSCLTLFINCSRLLFCQAVQLS